MNDQKIKKYCIAVLELRFFNHNDARNIFYDLEMMMKDYWNNVII